MTTTYIKIKKDQSKDIPISNDFTQLKFEGDLDKNKLIITQTGIFNGTLTHELDQFDANSFKEIISKQTTNINISIKNKDQEKSIELKIYLK